MKPVARVMAAAVALTVSALMALAPTPAAAAST